MSCKKSIHHSGGERPVDPASFIVCEDLPLREHIDITAAHVETAAWSLHGSAGPSGTDGDQWRSFLLRFGTTSERLREVVAAASTRLHANSVVD